MTRLLILLLTLIVLDGCSVLKEQDTADPERTYPESLGFAPADLEQLLAGDHAPGSYDLTAYVVGISECPPDFACFVPDHITVAASPHTDGPALMISAEKPSQFEQDAAYVLSIEVFPEAFPESSQSHYVQLLGYSEIN